MDEYGVLYGSDLYLIKQGVVCDDKGLQLFALPYSCSEHGIYDYISVFRQGVNHGKLSLLEQDLKKMLVRVDALLNKQ
jgi:hypothetical protein